MLVIPVAPVSYHNWPGTGRNIRIRLLRASVSLSLCLVLAGVFSYVHAQSIAQQERGLFEAAEADWNSQQFEQALQKYREFVRVFPTSPLAPDAHFQIGYYLSYVASADEAIAEYEQTIALAPGTHDAHEAKFGIAALKYWQQDYAGAYELFRQVLVETEDWATIKEATFRMKELARMIQLQKVPAQRRALVDCGPKALQLVLQRQHVSLSDQEIEKLIALGRQGATLEQLKEAAQAKGVSAWGVKLDVKQLASINAPVIVHIRPDHFVVVTKTEKDKIEFIDPHKGASYRTKEKFARIWKGYALVFSKELPTKLRPYILSKPEMEAVIGGHHLHGMSLGDGLGNPVTKFINEHINCDAPGLPHWSVNLANYNLLVRDTDFSYVGRGPMVGVTRVYNADDPRESAFGRSWTFNYDVFLNVSPNGSVDVKRETGKVDNFVARGDGTFDSPIWVHDQLFKNPDGTYKLILKGSKLTESFNSQNKLAQITDRNGNSVTLQYDTSNRVISVTDAVGRVTQFTYNAAGKIIQITDPISRKATFSYDANNNLISTVDMAGNVSTFTYDVNSYMTTVTTPSGTTQIRNGSTPHFVEFPNVVKDVIDPLGNTTHFDTGDYIAWTIDARGNQSFHFNGGEGATTQIEDPLGNKIGYSVDTQAQDLTGITDGNGHTASIRYGDRGNVLAVTDPLGNSTFFAYDARDNLTQITDALNRSYHYEYDAKDNLTRITDPLNGVTLFGYDSFGQLTSLKDARGNTNTFTYDNFGNLTKATNPLGGFITNTYDGVGRLLSQTDPKNQTFSYTYDGINRLTKITQPGGATAFTYGCCTLSTVTDASGTLSFVYDAANRLTQFTNNRNQIIKYAYDPNGNLTALTYPDGKVVHYEHDAANRLTKVTDWLNNTTAYSYDAANNLISMGTSNGTFTGYQYDAANRLTNLTNARTNGSVISAFKYSQDAINNRNGIGGIDAVASTLATKNLTSTYDTDNRILTTTGVTYSHDANGNVLSLTGSNAATYTYDLFNRLNQAVKTGRTTQYQYDGLGNRITRTDNGSITKFVISPGRNLSQTLAETDNAGNITSYYVYGLTLISKITAGSESYFYHFDGNGNTSVLTDTVGNIANRYAYDPFGNAYSGSSETVSNPFRFAGSVGVSDEGNGLLYMRARYYAPTIGRFVGKDPAGAAISVNRFVYGVNNPITHLDPSGLISCTFTSGLIDEDPDPGAFLFGLSYGVSVGEGIGVLLGLGYSAGFEETFGFSTGKYLKFLGDDFPVSASAGLSVNAGVGASSGLGLGVSSGSFSGLFVGYKCTRCP